MNNKKATKNLIEQQIRPWGGLNIRANTALAKIPRDIFVPQELKKMAFADIEIPLNDNVKMLAPKIEGRILDAVDIKKDETVLQIGTGSGYLTAVISELAKTVESIDIDSSLSNFAKEKLDFLAIENVNLKTADVLEEDFSDKKYDVIIITCAILSDNNKFYDLLNIGGRLFSFIDNKKIIQATITKKTKEGKLYTESIFETKIDYMQGQEPQKEFTF